jgi:hypothetical protein
MIRMVELADAKVMIVGKTRISHHGMVAGEPKRLVSLGSGRADGARQKAFGELEWRGR